MIDDSTNLLHDRVDQAISHRLSRLSATPVDTTRLARAIGRQIPRPTARWFHIKPLRAVAASLLILGTIAALVVLTTWSRPALASTQQLLEVHESVICSMDAGNQTPGCCLREVSHRPVACTAMTIDGAAVSLAVADATRLRMPQADTIERNGHVFRVHSAGVINMVMAQRNGRWACLTGPMPTDRL